jgi:hypothetical protein
MNKLLIAAYQYIENGICVIPVNKDKIPVVKEWRPYQDRMITKQELKDGFKPSYATCIAIVCGAISGNLEVLDIDCKYDLTGKLFESYMQDIRDNDEALADNLLIIKTRSGGYHLYYRCEFIAGNIKLALRPCSEDELKKEPKDKVRVLIETRGQGGYVVAPPSENYEVVSGNKIPDITSEQRELLFELAKIHNQIFEEPKKEYDRVGTLNFFTTPWDDFNSRGKDEIFSLLQKNGWAELKRVGDRTFWRRPGKDKGISGDYHHEKKMFKVFTTSSNFEEGHGYTHYGVLKLLECNNDSSATGKKLVQMGYGEKRIQYGDKLERDVFKKKQEGLNDEQLQQYIIVNFPDHAIEAGNIVSNLAKLWGIKLCTFWDINDKGEPYINRGKLIDFLHAHGGFALFYYDQNSTIFRVVQCRDGFLREASSEYMKKFIIDYVESLPNSFDGGVTPEDLKDLVLKGHERLFSSGLLEFLPRGEYNLLKDEVDAAYFPFRNGVMKITKDQILLLGYSEVDRVVWKTQVIDFDIRVDPDIKDKQIEYAKFIECVSGGEDDKYAYAVTILGYLLHKYKDPAKPYCIILAEENDNESKGGGTGKGIFLTAISKLVNTERVDGKNFKLDKNFAFQRVGLDTRLIAIEDTRKNVDFEGFYSIITEGITVEKKNKDELFIPYRDSPKIVFTTNYTIINNGAHARRRQKTFEFAAYFNAEKTPVDEFGHNLFDDWDDHEWNRFYNFMFYCCGIYLAFGIQEKESTLKVRRKHIRLKYGEEFLDFFDSWVSNGAVEWHSFGNLYEEFLNSTMIEKKFFSAKRFSEAVRDAAENIIGMKSIVHKKRGSGPGRPLEIRLEKENVPDNR